ncbi:uncharacterized protein LOC128163254 [Crassostrea angulata]|uniref:uncharacterized protein LOC128163254 n=1 Tax=Magallana angulata TaxID=2784310 RepID=UPI0022B17FA7|nr:uncharacterized protein LOC128163254 [Crassostrea angulata]
MYFLRKFCFLSKKLLVPGSGSSDTWPIVSVIVSVLLVAILLSEALLLTLAHRRGGLVLLGILIRFESKTATTMKKEEGHIKPDQDREISLNLRAGPTYEELNLSGIQVEKYEALELK